MVSKPSTGISVRIIVRICPLFLSGIPQSQDSFSSFLWDSTRDYFKGSVSRFLQSFLPRYFPKLVQLLINSSKDCFSELLQAFTQRFLPGYLQSRSSWIAPSIPPGITHGISSRISPGFSSEILGILPGFYNSQDSSGKFSEIPSRIVFQYYFEESFRDFSQNSSLIFLLDP